MFLRLLEFHLSPKIDLLSYPGQKLPVLRTSLDIQGRIYIRGENILVMFINTVT